MMNRIELANTDLTVFPLGLGAAQAGLTWEGKEADRLLDCFLDMGGNVIDTARVYSDWVKPEVGRSERVLGDWLKASKKRHQIVLMTKGGHPSLTVPSPDMHQCRMSRQDMMYDIDTSLQTLKTDYIDVYFYHRDNESQSVEELVETMEGFVKQGKIRYYACSNWTTLRMQAAAAYCKEKGYRGLAANQVLFNLGSDSMKPLEDDTMVKMDQGMYQYHKENPSNILMPYMGVCSGFFHKYLSAGEAAVKDSPYYTSANINIGKRLPELMKNYDVSVTQAVLGFFKEQEVTCIPLYGAKNIEQLQEAVKTYEIPFCKEDYQGIIL